MKRRSDASDASRARRRRIMIACLIVCTLGVAFNLGLMSAGRGSQWTVILFTVEASGVVASAHYLLSMRGQR
jgi:cytochrome c-type biogenesis protein CcmE